MTRISKSFTPMTTLRLLKRSARKPPAIENKMNGSANSAPMRLTSRSLSSLDKPMPVMSEMASHLRVLSLKAP